MKNNLNVVYLVYSSNIWLAGTNC